MKADIILEYVLWANDVENQGTVNFLASEDLTEQFRGFFGEEIVECQFDKESILNKANRHDIFSMFYEYGEKDDKPMAYSDLRRIAPDSFFKPDCIITLPEENKVVRLWVIE